MPEDDFLLYSAMFGYFLHYCKRKRDGGKEEIGTVKNYAQIDLQTLAG